MRDYLRALQILVYTGVAATVLAIAVGLGQLAAGEPLHTTILTTADIALPAGVKTEDATEIAVIVTEPTAQQQLLHALTQAPTAVLVLAVLLMLARLLRRARRSDPFTLETVRSLRWIGATLMLGILATAVEATAGFVLSSTLNPDRFGSSLTLPYLWVLGGGICLALAEVIQRGVAMRADLETVI